MRGQFACARNTTRSAYFRKSTKPFSRLPELLVQLGSRSRVPRFDMVVDQNAICYGGLGP